MEWREKKERNRIKVLFCFTLLHLIHKCTITHLSRRKGGILATDRRAIMRPSPPPPLNVLLSSPPDWKVERQEETPHVSGKSSVRRWTLSSGAQTCDTPLLLPQNSGKATSVHLVSIRIWIHIIALLLKKHFALIPFPNWDTRAS